jgi:hypothetical protein
MIAMIINLVLGIICIVHLYVALHTDEDLKAIKHTLLALFFLISFGIGLLV